MEHLARRRKDEHMGLKHSLSLRLAIRSVYTVFGHAVKICRSLMPFKRESFQ